MESLKENFQGRETVRFLPYHCMMQKVHSGVVVQLEGRKAVIEGLISKYGHLHQGIILKLLLDLA